MSRPTLLTIRAARVLLIGSFVGFTACASGGGAGGGSGGSSAGGANRDITRAEIEGLAESTAYSIVQQLRPRWLSYRTQSTPNNPNPAYAQVFVNDLYFGPYDSLYQISSSEIQRIEYLGARDATTRYGTGYLGGLIRVITR